MTKKKITSVVSLFLITVLLSACSGTPKTKVETQSSSADTEDVRLQDDFYEYINKEWLSETKLQDEDSTIQTFTELGDEISNTLQKDFDDMVSGKLEANTPGINHFLDFYKMMLDTNKRNKDDIAPALPYLEKIENISSLEDLSNSIGEFTLSGIPVPINIDIMTDMENSDKKFVTIDSPSMLLSDKSYYEKDNKEGKKKLKSYEKTYTDLLVKAGKTKKEAAAMVKNYLKIDALIAENAKSGEEASDVLSFYNPYSLSEANTIAETVDLNKAMEELVGELPETIIVNNPKFLENIPSIVNEENLQAVKDWMYIDMLADAADYLSDELLVILSDELADANAEKVEKEMKSDAYNTASGLFGEAIGVYYGQTYLGEEAKQDVTQMTENMIALYKDRLENVDWLSEETKANAIKKLDMMTVQMGYPDKLPAHYDHLSIDTEKSALDNYMAIQKATTKAKFDAYSQPADRQAWVANGHEVNAFYNPQNNSICFPAAILQKPYYHIDHSKSQNYGSIGTIIGHELSHAFDTNGSKFDEKGNLRDWWTEEDYQEFEKRAEAMINLFDGIKFAGGKVNGTQTVSENIADTSGLSIALEALKNEKEPNLEEFYISWATIWRQKASEETLRELLLIDTHSPNKLRANMQLSNSDDFYATFDVKEGDKMYLAPEERVAIW